MGFIRPLKSSQEQENQRTAERSFLPHSPTQHPEPHPLTSGYSRTPREGLLTYPCPISFIHLVTIW